MNTRIDVPDDVQAAWNRVFANHPHGGWKPIWFDEPRGFLVVECIDKAWRTQLRLAAPKAAEGLNAALPSPRITKVVAALCEARILVTGSRTWTDRESIADALLDAWHDAVQLTSPDVQFRVVTGDCPQGADAIAMQWAIDNQVFHEAHAAPWSEPCDHTCPSGHRKTSTRHGDYCPLAGPRRNQRMVDIGADLVLAFHRNNSRGTADCINRAHRAGIPVRVLEEQNG